MKQSTSVVDQYIASFPKETQELLEQIRATIKQAAPQATETIGYGIPTYIQEGNLVHFAAYKNHIGFYPAPSGLQAFKAALASYKGSKGAVQFPLNQALPLDTIADIVAFRVMENVEKAVAKSKKQQKE